jgi:membrane-associated HD superfamily phosphohydrolase
MNKKSGEILLLIVGGMLLLYTAFRSYDILSTTLPADAQLLAYIGLAGLDGGLIAWALYYSKSARGDVQRAVAMFMVVLQLAGVALTSIGDSLLYSLGEAMPEYITIAVVWGVPAIIAVNIAAVTVVHLADPQRALDSASREVEDEIQRQVAEHLRQNVGQIAGRIAPQAAEQRARELTMRFSLDGHKEEERVGQGE